MKTLRNFIFYCAWVVICLCCAVSCQKNEIPENPFDNFTPPQDTVKFIFQDPDSNSIAGLFTYIFKPTCANVGCHDGTFEPDFRTLESSYNTMVYKQPIKNDGLYTYRVHPFDPEKSAILARVTGKLLPFMPIQLEPDSDWAENRQRYIEYIRQWIRAGAPHVDGSIPGNEKPGIRLLGAFAMVNDTFFLPRAPLNGPIQLADSIENCFLYFALGHDAQNPLTFGHNRLYVSDDPHDFSQAIGFDLEVGVNPVLRRGFYGDFATHQHRVQLRVKELFPEAKQLYFRLKLKDQFHPLQEIPGHSALFSIKRYMSIERKD